MGIGSTMVAVRSVRLGDPMVDEEDEGRRYHQVDFTMVDLDTGKMYHQFLPSLYSCMGIGNMVKLGDPATLYVIGGARHPNRMSEKLLKLKEEKHPGYYMGACRGSGSGWQHIDISNVKYNYGCLPGAVTAMMGRIYCFGYPGIRPEVYDPIFDKWEFISTASLPEELLKSDTRVTEPVVPDPKNKRILVHMSSGHLYAFYPNPDRHADPSDKGGDWVCLSDEFHNWHDVAAVVDNVLYFHEFGFPSLLRAYDLNTYEWLAVVWSTLEVDSVYLGYVLFSGLFGVGQRVLCLAFWGRSVGDRDCPLEFFKFTVRRTSASALHLTPLSLKCFAIPCTETIFDLVPLKVELNGRQPSHLEFFKMTHCKVDGTFVDNTLTSDFLESDVFGVKSLVRKTNSSATGINSCIEMETLKSTISNMKEENQVALASMKEENQVALACIKKENEELRARVNQTNQILMQALNAMRAVTMSSEFLDAAQSALHVEDSHMASNEGES